MVVGLEPISEKLYDGLFAALAHADTSLAGSDVTAVPAPVICPCASYLIGYNACVV
jgi:hypothetical protein